MVRDRDFIFHMYIPCGKTFSLVPRSISSVKVSVKYQGHLKKNKNGPYGGIKFHKHSLLHTSLNFYAPTSIVFGLSVCPSFRLSFCLSAKTFTLAISFDW